MAELRTLHDYDCKISSNMENAPQGKKALLMRDLEACSANRTNKSLKFLFEMKIKECRIEPDGRQFLEIGDNHGNVHTIPCDVIVTCIGLEGIPQIGDIEPTLKIGWAESGSAGNILNSTISAKNAADALINLSVAGLNAKGDLAHFMQSHPVIHKHDVYGQLLSENVLGNILGKSMEYHRNCVGINERYFID
jgi:hypothetical protein